MSERAGHYYLWGRGRDEEEEEVRGQEGPLCVCAPGMFNQIRLTIAVSTHTFTHAHTLITLWAYGPLNTSTLFCESRYLCIEHFQELFVLYDVQSEQRLQPVNHPDGCWRNRITELSNWLIVDMTAGTILNNPTPHCLCAAHFLFQESLGYCKE